MTAILVVEDDAEFLVYYQQELGKLGHVWSAHNAQEAFDAIASVRFDLAVIDILLPDGDGADVARYLRGRQGDTCPIYVITILSEAEAMVKFEGIANVTIKEKAAIADAVARRLKR